MPGSSAGGRSEALEMILKIDPEPQTILDVGAGAGQWYDLLHQWFPDAQFNAVEIWRPYIEQYQLDRFYAKIWNFDVREIPTIEHDLVIFGDVIEHMPKLDAIAVVNRLLTKHALISIPLGPCPQDATENPYEEHLAEWSVNEVLASFSVVHPYFACQYPPPHYGRGVFLLEKR